MTAKSNIELTPEVQQQLVALRTDAYKCVAQLDKVIMGYSYLKWALIQALYYPGRNPGSHVALVSVPGLAKTLTIKCLQRVVQGSSSHRIQFTPDLEPKDLVGFLDRDKESGKLFVVKSRLPDSHIVLADEINRANPKTQSALLECMAEGQTTVGPANLSQVVKMQELFMVLATQNPIEQEGTYPLPEAQLDRFLFMVKMGYASPEDEQRMLAIDDVLSSQDPTEIIEPVTSVEKVLLGRKLIAQHVQVRPNLVRYIVDLINSTRKESNSFPGELEIPIPPPPGKTKSPGVMPLGEVLAYGASPRAALALQRSAKVHALLSPEGGKGKLFVTHFDVKRVAPMILRHRLILTPEARMEGITTDQVIAKLLDKVVLHQPQTQEAEEAAPVAAAVSESEADNRWFWQRWFSRKG